MITSALKKVDVAVFDTIKNAQAGKYNAGADSTFDLTNDGVDYAKPSAKGQQYSTKVDQIKKDIIDGKIANIPDTVK